MRKDADENTGKERQIAIFVPCWKESGVIENMIRHNLAAISYRNFVFFLGVYPNDEKTVAAVQNLADIFPNVELAACPHPGPTSKADCLNWIFQRMCLYEETQAVHFDTVVLHDAEDLIHPEALSVISKERANYAMVQVPVLPIPTPLAEFTHGIYCDDFAEGQIVDMRARQLSGSFIPSNGVGTGFAREILDQLATERNNLVFDPASLTEDYEIGVFIHARGYRQLFVPIQRGSKGFIATREYFPRRVKSAIRQRTRWVTGIALQCWERHGWRGSWLTRYWFWRDRKGLFANPLSLLTNFLFLAGAIDWMQSVAQHRPWAFAVSNPKIIVLCLMTTALQCIRLSLRMAYVARLFGLGFAIGVPFRSFHANFINCCATIGAIARFADARVHKRPLVWLKTEHAYPSRNALVMHTRALPEILVNSGYIPEAAMTAQLIHLSEAQLADHFLANNVISEDDLCKVLSLQSGLPAGRVDPGQVKARILRSLPAHVEKRFGVMPVGLESGRLLIAGACVPPPHFFEELKSFTPLTIDFRLVTRQNYEEIRRLLL